MRDVVSRGVVALVGGRKVINMCSNDYLGLSRNPVVIRAAATLEEISSCSSRLIAGNHPQISELEGLLASHRRTEAALLFPTGYMANLGAITALASESTTIFSDELNHASIIDGCRLSGAKIKVFRHNDSEQLELLMRNTRGRKLIVTEGIFSMDGDVSQLRHICRIAKEHEALTLVDDAHGDFVFGSDYSGVPSMLKVDVDVHISSLSKGLGCFGGYVAASQSIIDLLVNTSRQFIYTSAPPVHLCRAGIVALKLAKRGNLQKRLLKNAAYLRRELRRVEFVVGDSASQIIPVMIGSEERALKFSEALLDEGVYAQAVRYPTVKKGASRLRLSVTAFHSTEQLRRAVDSLVAARRRTNVP